MLLCVVLGKVVRDAQRRARWGWRDARDGLDAAGASKHFEYLAGGRDHGWQLGGPAMFNVAMAGGPVSTEKQCRPGPVSGPIHLRLCPVFCVCASLPACPGNDGMGLARGRKPTVGGGGRKCWRWRGRGTVGGRARSGRYGYTEVGSRVQFGY